jgi:Tfp pilus assembly protein PilW
MNGAIEAIERKTMHVKNGFLLIELMLGLLLSIFFIVIITHYIIEAKNAQQKALHLVESFSTARNEREMAYAHEKADVL